MPTIPLDPNYVSRAARALFACSLVAGWCHAQGEVPTELPPLERSLHDPARWIRFSSADGLPDDHVRDVVETTSRVWANTERGLAWYDGYRWHAAEGDGLPEAGATRCAVDGTGRVLAIFPHEAWIGDEDGFVLLDPPAGEDSVASGALTRDHQLLYGTRDAARGPVVNCYVLGEEEAGPHPAPLHSKQGVHSLISGSAGYAWFIGEGGACRWSDGDWNGRLRADEDLLILDAAIDDDHLTGVAYVRTPWDKRGIWEWDGDGEFVQVESFPHEEVLSLGMCSSSGAVLVLKESGSVRLRSGGVWSDVDPLPSQLHGASSIRFGGDGDLWVSTPRGLFLHRRVDRRWTQWRVDGPLPENLGLEIFRSSDGTVWLGTSSGLLRRRPGEELERVPFREREPSGIPELDAITAIEEDAEGNIWVGSGGGAFDGAYRLRGSEVKHFGPEQGLAVGAIHKIRRDRDGRLWFLGLGVGDVFDNAENPGAFVSEDGKFTHWGTAKGLVGNRVYAFSQTSDGALWFGTWDGLSRFADGEWDVWTEADGLIQDRVYTLAVDGNDRVWLGHGAHRGLGYIDDGDDEVHYVEHEDGPAGFAVNALAVDGDDHLWAATEGGLFHYDGADWNRFGRDEGLNNDRIHAVLPVKDRVYASTKGGGTFVLDLSDAGVRLPLIEIDPVVFDEGRAVLRWSAFSFWGAQESSRILTRHRVGGDWSEWSHQREVELDLPYGEYALEVQAKDFHGEFDEKAERREFVIRRPFHKTFVFLASLSTSILLIGGWGLIEFLRRHTEQRALQVSEGNFRQVAETIREVFWLADWETQKILFVSPAYADIWGPSSESLLDRWGSRADTIHPDDRDRVLRSFLQRAESGGYDEEFRIVRANGEVAWVRDRAFPIVDDATGRVVRMSGVSEDITAYKRAEAELRDSEERYRELVDSSPLAIAIHRDRSLVYVNRACVSLFGAHSEDDLLGRNVLDLTHPYSRDVAKERIRRIRETGGKADSEFERFLRLDGRPVDVEIASSRVSFGGEPAIQAVIRDVTDRKKYEERQRLLTRELDHRVKNTLAGVLAMSQQTMANSSSLDEFKQSFTGRIQAMARTHEALAASQWRGVQLGEIVRLVVAPYAGEEGTLTTGGDGFVVASRATSGMCMALHELATNASKYGAFSVPDGHVEIEWRLIDDGRLRFVWTETDGPRVDAPRRFGYGISLVTGVIQHELDGEVDFEFRASGLRCEILLPAAVGPAAGREEGRVPIGD